MEPILIKDDPVAARAAILDAYIRGGSQRAAAALLCVHESTLSRRVHALGMKEELLALALRVPGRGPDRVRSKARSESQLRRRAREARKTRRRAKKAGS